MPINSNEDAQSPRLTPTSQRTLCSIFYSILTFVGKSGCPTLATSNSFQWAPAQLTPSVSRRPISKNTRLWMTLGTQNAFFYVWIPSIQHFFIKNRPVFDMTHKIFKNLGLFFQRRQPKNLAQVRKISFVLTHIFLGRVGNLRHGLTIGRNHLNHDI